MLPQFNSIHLTVLSVLGVRARPVLHDDLIAANSTAGAIRFAQNLVEIEHKLLDGVASEGAAAALGALKAAVQ